MPPEYTPYALAALTAVLIPGGVSLVRMRRDVDALLQRCNELEADTREIAAIRQDVTTIKAHLEWIRAALSSKP
jgi:hypothetical protein